MKTRIKYMTAAAVSAGALSVAFAIEPPHITSAGSGGDFTPAQEAKSSTPVPPAPAPYSTAALRIPSTIAYTPADDQLADSVVAALNSDRSLKGSKLAVLAYNGQVTLSGWTEGQPQADKAARDAAREAGAGNVTNSIQSSSS